MGRKIFSVVATIVMTTAFATSAAAQTLTGDQNSLNNTAKIFAQELFGPNSGSVRLDINRSGSQSQLVLTYPADATAVLGGEYADITYTFEGAVLAEPITSSNLAVSGGGSANFRFGPGRDGGGGTKGSDFVSYRITSNVTPPATAALASVVATFIVPDLEMISVAEEEEDSDRVVTVTITVSPPASSPFSPTTQGFPRFPAADATANSQPSGTAPVTIARIMPAYSLTTSPASTSQDPHEGLIDLNDRSMLAATSTPQTVTIKKLGGDDAADVSAIKVSTVTVTKSTSTVLGADATAYSALETDRLRVRVAGNFAESDRLILSRNDESGGGSFTYATADLALTISGDGTTAAGSMPLIGTGGVDAESSAVTLALYYAPGGDDIGRGTIKSTYALDFAASTARDTNLAAKDLTLELQGINFTNYAYGIPSPTAATGDETNLRIRCEGASACTAFLRCKDGQGAEIGRFAQVDIMAERVEHISSTELAERLGVGVAGWNSRLSCSIHSSSRLAVQLLIRSGGTLTNNTFIGGLDAAD